MATVHRKDIISSDASEHPLAHASEYHAPVLCNAVVKGLITDPNGIYVDGTLGGGGHAEAILAALDSDGILYGIDRDEDALRASARRLDAEIQRGRLHLISGNFADLVAHMSESNLGRIDGLLLDLGVSSHQLDTAKRGFSHRHEGPLDMRMGDDLEVTALEILNEWSESELRRMLRRYGEEPRARRIVRAIHADRPLASTTDLTRTIRSAVPDRDASKTLSRVFQAIRIAVNNELTALEKVLQTSERVVRGGGRLVVISYHSLEDRRVKRYMRTGNFAGEAVRDLYGNRIAPWEECTRRPVRASPEEQELNPRSRSARLRIAFRTPEQHGTQDSIE